MEKAKRLRVSGKSLLGFGSILVIAAMIWISLPYDIWYPHDIWSDISSKTIISTLGLGVPLSVIGMGLWGGSLRTEEMRKMPIKERRIKIKERMIQGLRAKPKKNIGIGLAIIIAIPIYSIVLNNILSSCYTGIGGLYFLYFHLWYVIIIGIAGIVLTSYGFMAREWKKKQN